MRFPLIPTDGLCRICGRDAPGLTGDFVCSDCADTRPAFDRGASVFRFEGVARVLVHKYKYRSAFWLLDDFVDFLESAARVRFMLDRVACVVPMPTSLLHRWLRGYNQSALLAKPLAKRLELPYRQLLRRIGNPPTQRKLKEKERRASARGTFDVTRSMKRFLESYDPETRPVVLLIDDIMTTGSTLSEAARVLKAAGVREVWTLTLARSVFN